VNLINRAASNMRYITALLIVLFLAIGVKAQVPEGESWDKNTSGKEHPNIQWFKDAKFGLFIHWGLYSAAAGEWQGKNYYGISEWLMNTARIPAKDYATLANNFNPVGFNAAQWVKQAQGFGVKYMVVTAKHHEGFAMFKSNVSDFNIVDGSPYHKDPMKALSTEAQKAGLRFGFYYSQFVDWHEPNGGRNNWDFDESKKDYQAYYRTKAIPQLKELLKNYGPLDLIWFDQPGGMTPQQTQALIDSARKLQPSTLLSSRIGNGLGDFKDFGDGEVPALPVKGAWEALFTHNDSWGYTKFDHNFKTSAEVIHLLATVASKGGNLILNVGPDGNGEFPEFSVRYLTEVGNWLKINGASIYGSTYGLIAPQPWGVSTAKPGKLFLHVFNKPANGQIVVPNISDHITSAYRLDNHQPLTFVKKGTDILINAATMPANADAVIVVNYKGVVKDEGPNAPTIVSSQYPQYNIEAAYTKTFGKAVSMPIVSSNYHGDWKHNTCIIGMAMPADSASFKIRVTEPGDYKISLEYACDEKSKGQEGTLTVLGKDYNFLTLRSSADYDSHKPGLFIKHTIAIASIKKPGIYSISIKPYTSATEIFKLKTIVIEPVK